MDIEFKNTAEFAEAENAIKMDLQNFMSQLDMEAADIQATMNIFSGVGELAGFGVGLAAGSYGTNQTSTANNTSGKSFDSAFAENRAAGNKTFEWQGNTYNTKYAGE